MSDIYFSNVTFIHMIVIIASHMYGLVLVNELLDFGSNHHGSDSALLFKFSYR